MFLMDAIPSQLIVKVEVMEGHQNLHHLNLDEAKLGIFPLIFEEFDLKFI